MNPKNLKIPLEVLEEYNLSKRDVVFIKEPKENKVWVIHDTKNERLLILKCLNIDKTLFPILLHHQLSEIGFAVPKVFKTKTDQVYVQKQKRFYYVSEYINNLEKINEQQRVEALAEFHSHAKFSELMSFKEKIHFPSKVIFLKSYTNKLDEIKKWTSSISSSTLKDKVNEIIQIGTKVYHLMQTYDIEGYLQQTSKRYSICHGDFNMNNAFTTENGYLIIDFDRSYFGPPLEDFRFLMMSVTRNSKNDPLSKLNPLFKNYFKVCSEDLIFKDIYKTDSMFPHEFHKQVKQIKEQEKMKKLGDYEEMLVQLADLEKRKYDYLLKGIELI
jgi:thiamine kinase-like enzyme